MPRSYTIIFTFLVFGLCSLVIAKSYVHRGPTKAGKTAILRSQVAAKAVKLTPKQKDEFGAAEGFIFEENGEEEQLVVEVEAEISKDVIIWEELEEDGILILACTRDTATRKASVVLSGKELNITDYKVGVAFAIGRDSWEDYCGVIEEDGILDDADDYLFYVIDASLADINMISLSMTIVQGSEVVPEVRLNVIPEADVRRLPKKVVFEDEMTLSGKSRFQNDTLPVSVRPAVSGTGKVDLFDGATLRVDASLRADIKQFKVLRSWRLKAEWTQILKANFDASLVVDLQELSGRQKGDIFRKPVPQFGFSQKIWLVGRVRAGAFVVLQWLLELELQGGLEASLSAAYQSHRKVNAQLIPPKVKSTNMLPADVGSSGTSAIDFSKVAEIDNPQFTGFAGLRPALGVEVTLRGKGIGGNIGASVGLQASGVARKPAFLPFAGDGKTIGSCSDCHYFRGRAAVVGKDLDLQVEKDGKPNGNPEPLIEELFNIPLGTLCAFKGTCPLPTPSSTQSNIPTPTTTPSPSLSPPPSLLPVPSPSSSVPPAAPAPLQSMTPVPSPSISSSPAESPFESVGTSKPSTPSSMQSPPAPSALPSASPSGDTDFPSLLSSSTD